MDNFIENNSDSQPVIDNLPDPSQDECDQVVNPVLSNIQTAGSISTKLSENDFESIIKIIKSENYPLISDDGSDIEDLSEITEQNMNGQENIDYYKKKMCNTNLQLNECDNNQNNNEEICKRINLNVPETNLQKPDNINLVTNNESENMTNSQETINQPLKKITPPSTSRLIKISHKCSEACVWCEKPFVVYDNPNHIGRIRNIEKQTAFLKIEPLLKIDSCLCDRCWKFLEKTYKTNETENRKGNSIDDNKTKEIREVHNSSELNYMSDVTLEIENIDKKLAAPVKRNKYSKKNRKKKHKPGTCSVYNCFQFSVHPIPKDECIRIKKIFSNFDFCSIVLIEVNTEKKKSQQNSSFPIAVCDEHFQLINSITTCQLCSNMLEENLNIKNWQMYDKWNLKLLCDKIPLKLQPGMFICVTCQNYVSTDKSLPIDLEYIRNNVEKRNDVRKKLFGSSHDNISDGDDLPIIIANKYSSSNSSKVQFTNPLITSTHYFEPYNHKEYSKKPGKKKCHTISSSDFHQDLEIKSNKIIKLSTSKTTLNLSNVESEIINIAEKNPDYNHDNLCQIKSELWNSDEPKSPITVLNIKDIGESKKISTSNVNNVRKPNIRVIKMMDLIKKEIDYKPENNSNSFLPLPIHIDSSPERLTASFILNNTVDDVTNVLYATNTNFTKCVDVEKDMLPLHVSSILDNGDNIDNTIPDKIHEYQPVITNVYSQQESCKINIDLEKDNQNTNTDDQSSIHCPDSLIPTVIPTLKANSAEIRRKLRSVVCQRISNEKKLKNGGNKKLRLNETLKGNKKISKKKCISEMRKKKNSSYKKNCIESFINANIIHKKPDNFPKIVRTYSRYEYEDENIFSDILGNSSNEDESITNKDSVINAPPIHIESTYSLDPSCSSGPLRFHRTLKKVSDFSHLANQMYKGIKERLRDQKSDNEMSDNEIMSDKSQDIEHLNANTSRYQSRIKRVPTSKSKRKANSMRRISTLKSNGKSMKVISRTFEFPQLSKLKTNSVKDVIPNTNSDSEENKNQILFQLNDSNRQIYKSLLDRFKNENDVFRYLMENERMLYSGELILSKTADPQVTKYINKHLNLLHHWFGNPTDADASESFVNSTPVKEYIGGISPDENDLIILEDDDDLTIDIDDSSMKCDVNYLTIEPDINHLTCDVNESNENELTFESDINYLTFEPDVSYFTFDPDDDDFIHESDENKLTLENDELTIESDENYLNNESDGNDLTIESGGNDLTIESGGNDLIIESDGNDLIESDKNDLVNESKENSLTTESNGNDLINESDGNYLTMESNDNYLTDDLTNNLININNIGVEHDINYLTIEPDINDKNYELNNLTRDSNVNDLTSKSIIQDLTDKSIVYDLTIEPDINNSTIESNINNKTYEPNINDLTSDSNVNDLANKPNIQDITDKFIVRSSICDLTIEPNINDLTYESDSDEILETIEISSVSSLSPSPPHSPISPSEEDYGFSNQSSSMKKNSSTETLEMSEHHIEFNNIVSSSSSYIHQTAKSNHIQFTSNNQNECNLKSVQSSIPTAVRSKTPFLIFNPSATHLNHNLNTHVIRSNLNSYNGHKYNVLSKK